MPPALAAILARTAEVWAALSPRARLGLVAGAGTTLLVSLGIWAVTTLFVDYQVLFANLAPDDAATVVEALRAGKVPYRVGDNGQVLVPATRVHEWRLKLASQGVPSGGGVGFEIFDKNQFGLTDFAQRLNFQRALQGELARTIGQLREVQQARVHLALPAPRVFASQEKPASASVVLRLRPGAQLRQDQVRGIVHLVTASVEGLAQDRVTVVDSNGQMLMSGLDRIGGLSASQQEARANVEQEIERRVQSLLDPIVGAGHSAVRISALVNFDQIERTEERFDPKTLIRSQTKSTENLQGNSSQPMTTPGAAPQAPQQPREAQANSRTLRENEQTTYEISRTVEKTVVAPGEVRRLSIAVLLDVPVVSGSRVPRSDDEIERIKRLVASAAGVRADRRDELEVAQVSFDPTTVAPGEPAPREVVVPDRRLISVWAVGILLAIVAITAVVWRARRRRQALTAAVGAAYSGANVLPEPTAVSVVMPEVDLSAVAEDSTLKRQVLKVARDHPDEMAQLLRAWMFRRRAGTAS